MTQVVIENPILNSPYTEPSRHFKFGEDGITNEVTEGRRSSSYFIPIAQPKKKGRQLSFETEWVQERIQENKLINDIRRRVDPWRRGGHMGVTPTTARLLAYWTDPDREKKLFFCQIEALETLIYLTEAAGKFGDSWIENALRDGNDMSNPGLPRVAMKMATGSGKTVVMAMLIAWHTLNKAAYPQDARFTNAFLIVTCPFHLFHPRGGASIRSGPRGLKRSPGCAVSREFGGDGPCRWRKARAEAVARQAAGQARNAGGEDRGKAQAL